MRQELKLEKISYYPKGALVKSKRNRSVLVHSVKDDVLIEFRKVVEDSSEIGVSPVLFKVLKNKIHVTGVVISIETAAGLYACLHDYFNRVNTNLKPNHP